MVKKYSIIRENHVLKLLNGEINNSNDKNMLKARKILEYLSKNNEFISSEKIGTYMKNLDPLDISRIPKERKYWQKSYFDIINALIDVGLVERRKNARSFEYKLKTAFDKFDSVEAINFMKESLKNSGNYDQYSNIDTLSNVNSHSQFGEEIDKIPKDSLIRKSVNVDRIIRDTRAIKELKILYNNRCQMCSAVIELPNGDYSEGCHIIPLGDPHNGSDLKSNIVILCANHHVEFDYGSIGIDPNTFIIRHINANNALHEKKVLCKHEIALGSLQYHYNKIFNGKSIK